MSYRNVDTPPITKPSITKPIISTIKKWD
jgi:hypothetical protein